MSVSLAKVSDQWYPGTGSEYWNSQVLLPMYLSVIYPRETATTVYLYLGTNNLNAFADLLYLERHYDNATGTITVRN